MENKPKIETEKINSLIEFLAAISFDDFVFSFHSLDECVINRIKSLNDNKTKSNNKIEDNILKEWGSIEAYRKDLYSFVLSNRYKNVQISRRVFYRGLSNLDYGNVPGIYRKGVGKEKDEFYFFNEIQLRCPEHFMGMSNIDKLTYMQHYGCPTRLLDITFNPLVALYFACQDNSVDGSVRMFAADDSDVLYEQSDRIQMLAKLAEFKRTDQISLRNLAYYYLLDNKFPQNSNSKYKDGVVERFYHAVKSGNAAFEREIIPLDLLKPVILLANRSNPRILKQDGAFIVYGLSDDEQDCNDKVAHYLVRELIIPKESKNGILKELKRIGITQASLFPEIDQVASYLKNN